MLRWPRGGRRRLERRGESVRRGFRRRRRRSFWGGVLPCVLCLHGVLGGGEEF